MDEAATQTLEDFAALDGEESQLSRSISCGLKLFLGIFIGAVTFTGSVIAYGKLAGKVYSAAKNCPVGIC